MSFTPAQVNTLFQSILQRPADLAAVQAFAGRPSDQDAQIRFQIESSQEAQVNVNPVVRLYQGAFGRLPDTSGLQANVTNYINGYNLNSLATSFLAGPEAAAIFGSANPTVTNSFVQTIYQQALNRTGSTSELSYWVGTGKSAGQVLAEISNSSEAVNKTAINVVSFLDAQATAAGVPNGPANTAITGSLYNQTATQFNFAATETGAADAIVGSVNNDTITANGANVNAIDTINAGGGVDTLTITGTPQGVPGTINGLEVINIVGTGGNGGNNLNLSTANGLQLATLRGSTTSGDTLTLKSGVLAGFDAVGTATTAVNAENVTFVGTSTFGSAALANGSNINTLTFTNASTTLNIVSTGSAGNTATNKINTLLTNGGSTTTINISGDKALTIGGVDATVSTVNAAAATGAVTVNLTGTNIVTATGGTGNDKFTFAGTLTSADTVVGGTGTDTISITGEDLTTASNTKLAALNTKVSGVEVLELTGTSSTIQGGSTATSLTNNEITKILFNTSGADVINNAGSARTYAFGESNGGAATLNLSAGVTTTNISLEGLSETAIGQNDAAPSIITTLTVNPDANAPSGTSITANIFSTATSLVSGAATTANTIATLTANAGSTFKITGSTDLTVTTLSAGGAIDASGFTGKFGLTNGSSTNDVITLGSGGTASTGVNTLAGNDTVTATGGTNIINAGAGNDTITVSAGTNDLTGGAGADTITLGSGVDTIRSAGIAGQGVAASATTFASANIANGDTLTFGNGVDRIVNFTSGIDKLDVTTAATAATNLVGLSATLDLVSGTTYTARGTETNGVFTFSASGTDTLLVVGDAGTLTPTDTTGYVILKGITSLAAGDFI